MEFDFLSFLSRLDPSQSYSSQALTGGVVNFTVRAAKDSSKEGGGRFPNELSLILKQAPPYVAGVGPSAPISSYRQTIEARALSLFIPATGILHPICAVSSVAVPVLLHHDTTDHVLVISDLGACTNLSEVFSSLGGHNPTTKSPVVIAASTQRPASYFAAIGKKLGAFFARLHSPATLSLYLAHHDPTHLSHPSIREMVFEHAIKPIKTQVGLLPSLLQDYTAHEVSRRVEEDFLRVVQDDEVALVLGDCWTGAILVDSDEPAVGVIDWEFASLGRGPNGDMSQLLAHIHLFLIAADWREDDHLRTSLDTLLRELGQAYRSQSIAEETKWSVSNDDCAAPGPDTLRAKVMRSTFLSHGAELINCAFWKVWLCDSPRCGAPHPAAQKDCMLIRRMVGRGIWYLAHAGESEDGFVEETNWNNVLGESVVMGLFREVDNDGPVKV